MTDWLTTSINITKELRKFFDETNIKKSAFIRDLIINSKQYKDWKQDA